MNANKKGVPGWLAAVVIVGALGGIYYTYDRLTTKPDIILKHKAGPGNVHPGPPPGAMGKGGPAGAHPAGGGKSKPETGKSKPGSETPAEGKPKAEEPAKPTTG